MGFNISGIVINKNFKSNITELQRQLGVTLDFIEEVNFETASENWKKEDLCDIYFSEKGTLLFINMDMCIDAWCIADGITLTFALSETSMAFNFNYCEDGNLVRSFMEVNNDRLSETGEKLAIEKNTNDASEIILGQLGIVLGKPYMSIEPAEKAGRYRLVSAKRIEIATNKITKTENSKKTNTSDTNRVSKIIKTVTDVSASEKIFDNLISENDQLVLETVSSLSEADVNNHTLAYILNLSLFHRDSKVRKAAKKQLERFAPEDLLIQSKENWKDSYLKNQEYIHKQIYEHPDIDSAEFLVFSQAIRRNYFLVKPKTGMIPYAAMRYGDEIENIFDCYQVQLEKISNKISKLKHITVANFRKQPKLDISDTVEKLSTLPNLRFLQIADSQLGELPVNIKKLENLRTLIIEKNPISELPKNHIFQYLQKLDIQQTNISTIDIRQFPGLKELWIDSKKRLDALQIKNVDHDFIATCGQSFSETIQKQSEGKSNKWKFW